MQTPTAPEAAALAWWSDTLTLNEQKAAKALASLPDWFPQHYSAAHYRRNISKMYAQHQAAQK